MLAIGIRELKNRLSEYLRRVRAGEEILVTDRGEVIAEIRKPGRALAESPYPRLLVHAQRGKVRLGEANRADLYPRLESLVAEEDAARLLADERGDR